MKAHTYFKKHLLNIKKEYILLELYRAAAQGAQNPSHEALLRAVDYAKRKNGGLVEELQGIHIGVNFFCDPLDFSDYVNHHGTKALDEAICACQIKGIGEHPYLKDLEKKVCYYGMHGKFVRCKKSFDPIYRGIYFVCGYYRDEVLDEDMNLPALWRDQQINGVAPLRLHVERIGYDSPYATHQKVMHYCFNASHMRCLANMYDLPMLDRCSTNFLRNVTMLCRNTMNQKLGMTGQMENKIARDNFVPDWWPEEIKSRGKYEDDYIIHCAPEKRSLFDKTMVSLDQLAALTFGNENCKFVTPDKKYQGTNFCLVRQLVFMVSEMSAITVEKALAEDMFDRMLESGVQFSRADSKTHATFVFDSRYHDRIQVVYLQVRKKDLLAGAASYRDMVKRHGAAAVRGIHLEDLDRVQRICKAADISLCLSMPQHHFAHAANQADFEKSNFICTVGIPPEACSKFDTLVGMQRIRSYKHFFVNDEPAHGWTRVYGTLDSIKQIKAWLKEKGIHYFQAKPSVTQLTGIGAKTGFGPGKNTMSSILLVVDSICHQELSYQLLKAKFPEYFACSMEEVSSYGKTATLSAVSADLDRIFATAQHYDLPICFDENCVVDNVYDPKLGMVDKAYRLRFPVCELDRVQSMIEQIMHNDSYDVMLRDDQWKSFNHNQGAIIPPTAEQMRQQAEFAYKLAHEIAAKYE